MIQALQFAIVLAAWLPWATYWLVEQVTQAVENAVGRPA